MNIDKLRELLARVEAAEGPDVRLDHAIKRMFPDGELGAPYYTESIDAAVALAERVFGSVAIDIEVGHRRVSGKLIGRAEICGPHVDSGIIQGVTPALALCAAILRAKIAELEAA